MITIGILSGLLAAVLQGCSYFLSRHFLMRSGNALQLLIVSQLILAAVALPALPFLTPASAWSTANLVPLLNCSLTFLLGQLAFFQALRRIESSQLASIIGLKVVLVPFLLFLFTGALFSRGQLAALALALAAALLMNYRGGGRFQWHGMGYCFAALLFYSWSDIGVKMLVSGIEAGSTMRAALVGVCFNNVFIGLVLLPFAVKFTRRRMYREALPYALCWGAGIVGIFVCFGFIGPAFGNIVQSMRGVISLLIGIVLAHCGYDYLERKASRAVWRRRGAAALAMVLAIAVYALASLR